MAIPGSEEPFSTAPWTGGPGSQAAAFLAVWLVIYVAYELVDARALPRRRAFAGAAGIGLRAALALFQAAVGVALTGRPLLAAMLGIGFLAALAIGSNVKHRLLGEPLLSSDGFLAGQALRHPRLYLVEGRVWLWIGLGGALAALIVGTFAVIEPPFGGSEAASLPMRMAGGAIALAGVALFRFAWGGRLASRLTPEPDIAHGLARFGLVGTAVLHGRRWMDEPFPPMLPPPLLPPPDAPEVVIVVQVESLVDPVAAGLSAMPLPGLAAAAAKAVAHGPFRPPCFGAYTMRPEFGVLTGLAPGALGFDRFDPYLRGEAFAGHALANRLAAVGYRTVFTHPYDRRFFRRDRVMPAFGFQRFIGEEAFGESDRVGPYVGDAAVAERIVAEAEAATGRIFIHAVTIENHGPWRAGRLPGVGGETGLFLAHLANADRLVARLADYALASPQRVLLAIYGDHAPALAALMGRPGCGETVYVLLDNRRVPDTPRPPNAKTPEQLHAAIVAVLAGEAASPTCGGIV